MKIKYYLFTLVALLSTVTSFSQVQTLDQDAYTTNGSGSQDKVSFGQSFVAGMSGSLTQFNFKLAVSSNDNANCELKIYSGVGTTGTLLSTQPFQIFGNTTLAIQVPITNAPTVIAGNTYSAVVTVLSGGFYGSGSIVFSVNYSYDQFADKYVNGSVFPSVANYPYTDMNFQTYVTQTPAHYLQFDGTNDFVTLGSIIPAGSSYTKEAIIKPNAITGVRNILSSSNQVFWINDGTIKAGHGSNFAHVSASAAVLLNTWTHVAVTYDAPTTTMKLYINGVMVSQNTSVPVTTSTSIQVGAYASVGLFSGGLDEVRIWNKALSAAEINSNKVCELSGSESGILANYTCNQGIGFANNASITTLTDTSSNGFHGTLNGFELTGSNSNFLTDANLQASATPTLFSSTIYSQNNPAAVVGIPMGTSLLWYTSATGGTGSATVPTLTVPEGGSASYWVSAINAKGCESDRVAILVLSPATVPNAPSALHLQVYAGDDATLTALAAVGTNLQWFATRTGGAPLALTTALVNESTYYVSQSVGTSTSSRTAVKVKKISTASQTICSNATASILITTPTTDAATKWFAAATGGTALTTEALTSGSYYVEQTVPSITTTISTGLNRPAGITTDIYGNVYVTDTYNHQVKKMDANGNNVQVIGSGFTYPGAITVDVLGNVYVANNLARIKKMNSSGNNITNIGDFGYNTNQINHPDLIATDASGTVYVLNYNTIKKMDNEGNNVQQIFANFPNYKAMTADAAGTVYLLYGEGIKKLDASGNVVQFIANTSLGSYKAIALGGSGTIYLADNTQIVKLNADGSTIEVIASGFVGLNAISVDASGAIYVATGSNTNEGTIHKVKPLITTNRALVTIAIESVAVPTFTAPTYVLGVPATPLTATSGATGLLWYEAATGGTGVTELTPTYTTTGTTSYWVSSTNDNGCESERVEMVVTVVTAPGTHLKFDGIDDFVNLGTSAILKPTTALTVEFNAYSSNWSGITNLATLIGNTQSGGYAIGVSGTSLSAVVRRNNTYASILKPLSEISSGWHHFAMTYDNQNLRFYMDGVLIGTNNAGSAYPIVYNPNNSTILGGESSGTPGLAEANRYFNGGIDDLRIWNVARSVDELNRAKQCELLGTEPGLVAYFKFNHGYSGLNNIYIPTLLETVSDTYYGTLSNFTKNGITSNFLAGSPIVTGIAVPAAPTAVAQNVLNGATVADLVPAPSATNAWYATATGGETLATDAVVTAGTYYVSALNANGCESTRTSVVVTITYFVLSASEHINVSCAESITGSATVSVSGGTAPFTYSWSPSGGTAATASNLAVGNYTVTVTDADAHSEILTFNITGTEAPVITAISSTTICLGTPVTLAPTVTSATVSGSSEDTLQYAWVATNGGIIDGASDELSITVSASGTYSLTVTDSNGCSSSKIITVSNQTTSPAVYESLTLCYYYKKVSNLTVVNSSDVVKWYDVASGGTALASNTIVVAGTYYVSRTLNGCESDRVSVPVNITAALTLSLVSKTDVTCHGSSDGTATIAVSGGVGPYSIGWNNGAVGVSDSNLPAGTFFIAYVYDIATGCEVSYSHNSPGVFQITITEPDALSVTASKINASSSESTDGSATVSVSGGTGAYTYLWNDDAATTTASVSGLSVGSYSCLVTDDNGCSKSVEVVITVIVPPTAFAVTGGGATCEGGSGVAIGLSDSETGVTYQLQMGSNPVGDAVSGTGEALSFGNFTTAGTYTVIGLSLENEIVTTAMTGNAVVSALNYTVAIEAETVTCISQTITLTGSIEGIITADALSWTASNGGVISGLTNALTANVTSSGTYTLTATVNGCTFSENIVVNFDAPVIVATTWNGMAWSNGQPHVGMKAIIDGALVVSQSLEACEVVITENGSLTIQSGAYAGIIRKITNNAGVTDFIVENKGVLIQLKNLQNEGPATVKVNSFPLYRQDYTLWSSPVKEQNLRVFSPQTLFNRFSTYNTGLGTVGEYVQEIFTTQDVATKQFEAGNGYLIRMPNNWTEFVDAATPGVSYPGVFKGVPQNGTLTVPLSTANIGMNLVGNPYPSPIVISTLFAANPDVEHTIYFWRKRNGALGTGYATYNNMGFVTLQTGLSAIETAIEAKPYIGSGQGFFVKSTGATQLNFNNGMRNFQSNGVFLRQETAEMHRFKLNLSTNAAVVGQTLVGYTEDATAGVDNGFDSSYFNDSSTAITSLISGNEYIIQGLGVPFETTSTVPLGFKTNTAGMFSISLEAFDGLFADANQDIYIKDNVTGEVHNVKESAYNFITAEGVFNTRFEVVYQNSTLGTTNPDLDHTKVMVYKQDEVIYINTIDVVMQKVELYDIRGRLIQVLEDVNQTTARFNHLNLSNQVLLVKITDVDHKIITKKIVY